MNRSNIVGYTLVRNRICNLRRYLSSIKDTTDFLDHSREPVQVPKGKFNRLMQYSGLALKLSSNLITKRFMNRKNAGETVLSEDTVKEIVHTLCTLRGAALKVGQMLSIQDANIFPPHISEIFEKVRNSARPMPITQLCKTMSDTFGDEWNDKFKQFDMNPFAAASIGQVHRAVSHDGDKLAVKIQYPGVSESISSDIATLGYVIKYTNLVPESFYLDNLLKVAGVELFWEVDYQREASYYHKFRKLLETDKFVNVPQILTDLSVKNVLTSHFVAGDPVDRLVESPQEIRNHVGFQLMKLCVRELFEFKLMQTDPNWANFLYDKDTNKINLIDFGSSREYSTEFVQLYASLLRCASKSDREGVLHYSRLMKFLTGYESQEMVNAHLDAVMILAKPFCSSQPFDFSTQDVTKKISNLIPIMLYNRLTPPPEETVSLHRKLSGIFLLCSKLRVKIPCMDIFELALESYSKP